MKKQREEEKRKKRRRKRKKEEENERSFKAIALLGLYTSSSRLRSTMLKGVIIGPLDRANPGSRVPLVNTKTNVLELS